MILAIIIFGLMAGVCFMGLVHSQREAARTNPGHSYGTRPMGGARSDRTMVDSHRH